MEAAVGFVGLCSRQAFAAAARPNGSSAHLSLLLRRSALHQVSEVFLPSSIAFPVLSVRHSEWNRREGWPMSLFRVVPETEWPILLAVRLTKPCARDQPCGQYDSGNRRPLSLPASMRRLCASMRAIPPGPTR